MISTIFKIAAVSLFVSLAVRADEDAMPAWPEGAPPDPDWIAGSILLSDDPLPEDGALIAEEPTAEELAEPQTPPGMIHQKYLTAYFGERPKSFLVDPQGLLSEADQRSREAFLSYHAADSAIDLFVYIFGQDQQIPDDVREEEITERFFTEGKPAVVVFYYLGMPQRTTFYISPRLTGAVSYAEQRRAFESALMMAFQTVDPAKQLEAFMLQMSIRVYWIEQLLGIGEKQISDPSITMPVVSPAKVAKPNFIKTQIALLVPYLWQIAAAVVVLIACSGAIYWRRARMTFCFPEFEVEPRLGGAHAAGIGAVISFSNRAQPPASQRNQVPDYLRRSLSR